MFYLIAAVLIWASAFIAAKFSYTMFDPALTVMLRLILSALLVLPTFFRSYRKIPKQYRLQLWGLGLLNFPVVLLLQFTGVHYTSVASAVTMLGTEPLVVTLLGHIFFHKPARLLDWLLGIVALTGIVFVVYGSEPGGEVTLLGCTLVLLGSIAFSFSIHLAQSVMKAVEAKAYTDVIIMTGAISCVPFSLLLIQDWQIHLNIEDISAILYLSVGCTWLAYRLWSKGLRVSSANTASILTTLEPVFGVLLAILLLGEHLTLTTLFGICLVISAAGISVLSSMLINYIKNKVTIL
ncbi:DMT family transporter [Basfia succiniciproducens]|uniref:DMT family transporter n=1 Tax=Basfia succiniciproducens TaxID=653940 RepID=UPI003FCC907D